MSRIGKITDLGTSTGFGEIIDENDQEILFSNAGLDITVKLGMKVLFSIEMGPNGLTATQIRPVVLYVKIKDGY